MVYYSLSSGSPFGILLAERARGGWIFRYESIHAYYSIVIYYCSTVIHHDAVRPTSVGSNELRRVNVTRVLAPFEVFLLQSFMTSSTQLQRHVERRTSSRRVEVMDKAL